MRSGDGHVLDIPPGWVCLAPGDAGLTRRVKAAGPSITVVEKVGRKTFSRGVWAPAANITAAKSALLAERSTPAYEKKRVADEKRRESTQSRYVEDFEREVREFLRFARRFSELQEKLARAVTAHATPVGSGTVARTKRIEIDRRAEAAVIAWMRHQTTAYDLMKVARVKGARREVRRELARISRALLDLHRHDAPHSPTACPLCSATSTATSTSTSTMTSTSTSTSTPTPTPTPTSTSTPTPTSTPTRTPSTSPAPIDLDSFPYDLDFDL